MSSKWKLVFVFKDALGGASVGFTPEACDELVGFRVLHLSFLSEASTFEQIDAMKDRLKAGLLRLSSTEYENWIARIVLGAGSTRVKKMSKSLNTKQFEFVRVGGDPAAHIHPALSELAKPVL